VTHSVDGGGPATEPDPRESLLVRRADDGAGVVVAFTGELDIATLAVAEEALAGAEDAAPDVLTVDLSGLAFVDSSGVRLVLRADARARDAGRRLAVLLGRGPSRRLFEVLGLLTRLDVRD
jgi:anti-sigma B factor antagonist